MMTKFCLFFLMILPAYLLGQEIVKIEDTKNIEVYNVLASDSDIRHGAYERYARNGQLIATGRYEYGGKEGQWEYYDLEGKLVQVYDHSEYELISYEISDEEKEKPYRLVGDFDTLKVVMDRPPMIIGGASMMGLDVYGNIRYPAEARKWGIEGTVEIAFTIDKEGIAKDHYVKKGIGYGCDEECLWVVQSFAYYWTPAILNGEPEEVEYVFPIKFTLE